MRRCFAVGAIVLASTTTFAACSSNKSNSNGSGSSGANSSGAASVVAKTVTKTFDAGSANAAITLDYTKLPGVTGEVKLTGTSELNFKDNIGHLHLDIGPLFNSVPAEQRKSLPANAGDVDIIYAGTVVYMKAPAFNGVAPNLKPWFKLDLSTQNGQAGLEQLQTLGGGNDPAKTLKMLNQATAVTVVGKEDVRGTATTHYRATINFDQAIAKAAADEKQQLTALKKQTGATSLPIEVWVDGNGRTRRVQTKVASPGTSTNGNQATEFTITSEYFDFGSKVTVNVPPTDQVSDLGGITGSTTTTKKP